MLNQFIDSIILQGSPPANTDTINADASKTPKNDFIFREKLKSRWTVKEKNYH